MFGTTIVAVSTPPGAGARAVLRLSGPEALRITREVARLSAGAGVHAAASEPPSLEARGIYHGQFLDGRGQQPLMLLWMPGPHSYTREDTAEFHLPGSPPLVEAALARLVGLGAEPAARGEFTRRAFLSGRLDLTRAEGVLLLVEASSEVERRSASALLFGGLAERVEALRETLVDLRVLCEASLDFDETDTGHVDDAVLARQGAACLAGVEAALRWEERREPTLALPTIVLAGEPNAGKSSLFNRLVATRAPGDQAIVSGLAGTTRDAKSGLWSVAGGDCRLVDTAGYLGGAEGPGGPEGLGEPEHRAAAFARAEQESADLLLWVVDAAGTGERSLAAQQALLPLGPPRLLVWNQIDRPAVLQAPGAVQLAEAGEPPFVAVSAGTGAGLDALEAAAARWLGRERVSSGQRARADSPEVEPAGRAGGGAGRELSVRHRQALERSRAELAEALDLHGSGAPLDLVATGLRSATNALDAILGGTTSEDLLDRIFARFCLGK